MNCSAGERNNALGCLTVSSAISAAPAVSDVCHLLRRVASSRTRLQLLLPDGSRQPVLVADVESAGAFTLTPLLSPDDGLMALQAGDAVALDGRIDGAPLHLTADLSRVAGGGSALQLLCGPPQSLTHDERRAMPRFLLPPIGPDAMAVVHLPGEILLARLRDISRGGARLELDPEGVELGDTVVPFCEIRRGDQLLQLKAEVRWKALRDGHQHFGVRFLVSDPAVAGRVDRFVAEIERYWLRQRRGE